MDRLGKHSSSLDLRGLQKSLEFRFFFFFGHGGYLPTYFDDDGFVIDTSIEIMEPRKG